MSSGPDQTTDPIPGFEVRLSTCSASELLARVFICTRRAVASLINSIGYTREGRSYPGLRTGLFLAE